MDKKIRTIAFYLPQFYPTKENDEWWEPGFTEWTNVVRSQPLFKGHYQPRIPRELGFYDLRVPETREKQANLAREAGIEGFCYWHYWFGNGKRLLSEVFSEVVESGKPDFPFCLCWANHSWYAKTWDPNSPDRLLMEQLYPGEEDFANHFYAMLNAFKDERYIKVDGRLLFGIFDSDRIPNFRLFKDTWNRLAKENGLEGFYFFGLVQGLFRMDTIKEKEQFDCFVLDRLADVYFEVKFSRKGKFHEKYLMERFKMPHKVDYDLYTKRVIEAVDAYPDMIPCVDPDFDHSPRSGYRGIILDGSTPEKWGNLLKNVVSHLKEQQKEEKLLFIKAWNEWGECNYLEPDRRWGTAYLDQTKEALNPDKQ